MDTNAQNTSDPNIQPNSPDLSFQPSASVSGESGVHVEIPVVAPISVEHTPEPVVEQPVEQTVEQPVELAPEVYKTPETVETISPAPTVVLSEDPLAENVVPLPKAMPVVESIVDKRTNHESLAKVKPNADPVTLDADKNEEEFIAGVEIAHEHK